MRYFNTSGPNNLIKHYTLPRLELVEAGIKKVDDERYFTIWAPRQTGKSTYFRLLATALKAQGYAVIHTNVEGRINPTEYDLCEYISNHIEKQLGITFKADKITDLLEKLSRFEKKTIFIIDEIEQVNPDLFNEFLHAIRAYYHHRDDHNLKSVILVGVSNITGIIQDHASPFNIADNFDIPYFSEEEVFELYGQHESESGQIFDEKIKKQIYHITAGQPGLVNGFALRISDFYKNQNPVGYDTYLEVEDWFTNQVIDKNISNILNKAKQERRLVERLLFEEAEYPFKIYDEAIRFLHVQGVVKRNKEGNVEFWVPLYKKCLQTLFYPALNGESSTIQENIDFSNYFSTEIGLNIDKIIRDYQVYAKRRGFRYFLDRNPDGTLKGLREAALVYSFETYIQSFLSVVQGKSYLEAHVALGRSDLIVNIQDHEFVIEAKLFSNPTKFRDGKKQLAYYVNRLGLKEGVYLVFIKNTTTNPNIQEAVEDFDGIKISTYLVGYDVETDFG